MSLKGQVALVTGGTRGIGKGIAMELAEAGATVYVTGRTKEAKNDGVGGSLDETVEEMKAVGGVGVGVVCDHSKDEDVKALFEQLVKEAGRLDILVNNAYAAVNAIGKYASKKFWEEPEWMWDCVNNVGLRNHYLCTYHAARLLMVPQRSGLIVNVSSYGGIKYVFNAAYGVGKAAMDRMAADCGSELRSSGVTMISLMPGAVRTEEIMAKIGRGEGLGATPGMKERFLQGETTAFPGRCIVALANDPNLLERSGKILLTCDLADDFGLVDIDGRVPSNIRSLKAIIDTPWIGAPKILKMIAWFIPSFIKIPKWMLHLASNKFG